MMMKRLVWTACVFAIVQTSALAQTLTGDRLRIGAGSCVLEGLYGPPNEVQMRNCTVLSTQSATNLTIKPGGDLILAPAGSDILPDTGYTKNLGALTNKYLTLHAAELWVETLVAQNTIATIGGRVLVAPTTTLTADIGTGATSITVKHNQMANGDRVYLEANGSVEWMAITSSATGSGPYTYTVTRNLDGSGANNWYAGDAVLNTGTTGKGYIDLYSVSGVLSGSGPSVVGNVRTGTTYSQVAPRWAIGNLNGLYGYGAETYGAAFGDASATNVTIDATNGFRIRSGTTNKLQADTSGNLSMTGDLSLGTSGVFRANATGFATGTGWWMDYNGGTPRFRIGNPAGNQLSWDGSTLTVSGNGSGLTAIDGGQITTGTINVGSINATGFGGNLVRNGRFEGSSSAAALSGWYEEERTGGAAVPTWYDQGGNGTEGPGYLDISTGDGYMACAAYRASPTWPTQKYRVRAQMLTAGGSTTVGFHVLMVESSSTSSSVRNIVASGASSPDVNRTSYTALAVNVAGTGGWQEVEYTYTVPSGVLWAAVALCNVSGSYSSSTYRPLVVDGVEFQEQVGPGHIKANSITASQIAAGTITATQIASGTITSSQIAAGTITASNIASGTITATQIASGTITATQMNVSSLSSISANIGSITSGSINIGSGNFQVDSSGNLQATGAVFYGGAAIHASVPSVITLDGAINTNLGGGGGQYVCVDNGGQLYASSSCP